MKRKPIKHIGPRPEVAFRLPEGDVGLLRQIYDADKWKEYDGIRDILEAGYRSFKGEIIKEKALGLPDTFKDLLDKEEAQGEGDKKTFPAFVYMATIRHANYIWDDTETARELIDRIEKGDFADMRYRPPRRIFEADTEKTPGEVSDLILDKEGEGGFHKRLAEIWLQAELFTNPEGRLADMIRSAKNASDREKLEAALRPIVEKEYKEAARAVAKETRARMTTVLSPEKRTEEQYKKLVIAVREIIAGRIDTIYKSNFVCALIEIISGDDAEPLETKLSSATLPIISRYAALYFFALHPEIDLRAEDALGDADLQELKEIHRRLLPFMEKAMREAQKKKEFLGAWEAFMRFIEAETPIEEERDQIKEIVRAVGHETKNALRTMDKVNSNIWTDLQLSKPTFEQMQLSFAFEDYQDDLPAINTASRKDKEKGNDALILWGLRFDELPDGVKITKQLEPYDRLCYEAVGSLYREATEKAGEKAVILTPAQICRAMGYTSTPPKKELDKIRASLQKMRAAIIYIDNTGEKKVNKKYPSFRYEGALLPWDRLTVYVKGKVSRDGIRILAYRPLIDFAIGRKQITSFPLEVYQFPISKSQQHLRIAQYLIDQICHMKNNPEYSRKLTFATIFSRCFQKAPSWKQKNDAKEAIKKLLGHWSDKCAFIGKGSRIEKEFIEIDLAGAKHLENTKKSRTKK